MNKSDWKIICGDAFAELPRLADNAVDCVIADIPYGEVNRDSKGLRNLDKNLADIKTFDLSEVIPLLVKKSKGSFYIFCGTEQVSEIRRLFVGNGLSTRLCIWEKTNPSPMNGQHIWLSGIECCVFAKKSNATFNEHCQNSVWRLPTEQSEFHPTQKPVSLMRRLVRASTNPFDTVLDFTAGSFSTGVACAIENRNFIGIEINPEYCAIGEARIRRALGQGVDLPRRMVADAPMPLFETL